MRLFDERGTLPRLLLLDLSGLGYLVLHHGQRAPTLTQWILALIAYIRQLQALGFTVTLTTA